MGTKDYPREEMELRWTRARERMDHDGLDALLVTERGNYWWLGGARVSTQFFNKMRPNVAVVPRKGDPFLIGYGLEKSEIADAAWVDPDRIYTYVDAPFPPDVAVQALKEAGLERGKIGLELGSSQRMWFSINDVEAIREGLPQAQLVDGSPTIEWLRLHKTPLEVQLMRASIDAAQRALDRLYPQLRIGMTARDAASALTILMVEEGADLRNPGGIGGSFMGMPDDTVMDANRVMRIDFGAVRQGYWSDICRRVTFAPGNDEALRDQEFLWRVMQRCFNALGPGVPVTEIHRIHNEELQKGGHPPVPAGKRIGHGLGMDPSEPPSLNGEDPTILEPGMVVTVEPRFNAGYGMSHIEEDFIITENGFEMLSGGQSEHITVVG